MIDLLAFLYLLWRASAGLATKPSTQLNALFIRLLIIGVLSGFFLITHVTGLIETTFEQLTSRSGLLITLFSMILAIIFLFNLRPKILDQIDNVVPDKAHRTISVIISIVRGVLLLWVFLVILSEFPLDLFKSPLENSGLVSWMQIIQLI